MFIRQLIMDISLKCQSAAMILWQIVGQKIDSADELMVNNWLDRKNTSADDY
jgi:hypothetical protein